MSIEKRITDIEKGKEKIMPSVKKCMIVISLNAILGLFSLHLSNICYAEKWIYTCKSDSGTIYIDIDSLVLSRSNQTIKLWSKTVLSNEGRNKYKKNGVANADKYNYSTVAYFFNYGVRTYQTLAIHIYDFSDHVVANLGRDSSAGSEIPPGSVMETLMRQALELSGVK
jgi:hypothetical protein